MGRKASLLVEDIFNRRKGWTFSQSDVPITRGKASDGNPTFIVEVDGIAILVFQVSQWALGSDSDVAPDRIVAVAELPGVEFSDPMALLRDNDICRGLPTFGIGEDGTYTLTASVPISPNLPIDIVRRQLLVCMGLTAENANSIYDGLSESEEEFDWDSAKKVAKVAGVFLGAMLGVTGI